MSAEPYGADFDLLRCVTEMPFEWRYLGGNRTRHVVRDFLQPPTSRLSDRKARLACGREGQTYGVEAWGSRKDDRPCRRCLAVLMQLVPDVCLTCGDPHPNELRHQGVRDDRR